MKWRLCRKGNHTHLAGACLECRRATAETSTQLESASASHQGAVASLLEQVEECSMAAPSQRHKDHSACTWLVEVPAAETSTHLASAVAQAWWSSHKLARSGGAFDGSSVAKAQRPSASTSYRIAVLLTQVERSMVAATSQKQSDHHAGAWLENLGVRR